MVPLLRMVNIGNNGSTVSKQFQNPYYFPLSKSVVDTVGILLCDEYGDNLKLDKGPVTLTLHFRKRSSLNKECR